MGIALCARVGQALRLAAMVPLPRRAGDDPRRSHSMRRAYQKHDIGSSTTAADDCTQTIGGALDNVVLLFCFTRAPDMLPTHR